MLHVQYTSIDDLVITTIHRKKKKRFSSGYAMVDLAHLVSGQAVASLLSLCMTAQMATRLTLRSSKPENRKVSISPGLTRRGGGGYHLLADFSCRPKTKKKVTLISHLGVLSDILRGHFDEKRGNTLPGARVNCKRPVGCLPPEIIQNHHFEKFIALYSLETYHAYSVR